MATLEIRDLHVSVVDAADQSREILRGVDLTVKDGEIHAIMGPNGSGKSTLAYAIAGHPKYRVTQGSVTLDGEDVLSMSVDARARAGLFLAMQYPVEVPGVSVSNFLRTAMTAVRDETDSGLDVDALKVVSEGINRFRAKPGHGVLLITHYNRILQYVHPDFVHVFVAGRIVEEGGPELAKLLESEGYERFTG